MKKLLCSLIIAAAALAACTEVVNTPTVTTYTVVQAGGASSGGMGSATTTGVTFIFSAPIASLNVTAADIIIGGAASKGSAVFSGSGARWTLAPITVNTAGTATVAIARSGIETETKTFTVYKAQEQQPGADETNTGETDTSDTNDTSDTDTDDTDTKEPGANETDTNDTDANKPGDGESDTGQPGDTPPGDNNPGISAAELVAQIKIGWNLGNTLDANSSPGDTRSVQALETLWSNPITTQANINAIKNAGFNAVRIPVSWAKAADTNYNIRADWMARVKEVVGYAVNNDMYILLNTHHDEDIFKFHNAEMEETKKAFKKIWEQIADAFKTYNEKLIFEGLNEPRTPGSAAEWTGGTAEERNNINILQQLFVDTVRASGGNNTTRVLLISGHGASAEATVLNAIVIPDDPLNTVNKMAVSIHSYSPYNFALNTNSAYNTWDRTKSSDTADITNPINRAYNTFVSKGIPVIIGEFGAMNKDNEAIRAEWGKYYVEYAREKGIPCFWWDNGVITGSGEKFGLLNRTTNNFTYPILTGALTGQIIENDPNPAIDIYIGPNGEWGWQTVYPLDSFLGGEKITNGKTYTFTYTFTSNVAMSGMYIGLVDNSAEAVDWWDTLANNVTIHASVAANTVISGSVKITANKTASSASGDANKLILGAGTGTQSAPTLTFTVLQFEEAGN